MQYKIDIPTGAQSIISILKSNGYEAYVVGGCVRDSILGIPPKDWDICTSATVENMYDTFRTLFHILPTGERFGTITIFAEDRCAYEVTTFRIEKRYSHNRFPVDVKFTDSLKQDLSRRDFTVNAMAYNDEDGLIDLFGGLEDLKNGIIKCVGNPCDRFQEDALRILRAWRLSCQLGFIIDENTVAGMKLKSYLLKNIAMERIKAEFVKAITHVESFVASISYMPWILELIIPEWKYMHIPQENKYHVYNVDEHTLRALLSVSNEDDTVLKLAILLHDIGKPSCKVRGEDGYCHYYKHADVGGDMASNILKHLRFPNNIIDDTVQLIKCHDATFTLSERHVKRWLNKIGERQFRRLLKLRRADVSAHDPKCIERGLEKVSKIEAILEKVISDKCCFKIRDLAINGKDLIEIGYKEGKSIGCCLDKLLFDVIDCNVENSRDVLLNIAKAMLDGLQKMEALDGR